MIGVITNVDVDRARDTKDAAGIIELGVEPVRSMIIRACVVVVASNGSDLIGTGEGHCANSVSRTGEVQQRRVIYRACCGLDVCVGSSGVVRAAAVSVSRDGAHNTCRQNYFTDVVVGITLQDVAVCCCDVDAHGHRIGNLC